MVRKTYYELMDKCYETACCKIKRNQLYYDSASYFVNLDMIRQTKRKSCGNERLFYVADDGSLMPRTDEFR